MSGLMRGGWKRGFVSGGSACKYCVDSAGHKSHRASLLLYRKGARKGTKRGSTPAPMVRVPRASSWLAAGQSQLDRQPVDLVWFVGEALGRLSFAMDVSEVEVKAMAPVVASADPNRNTSYFTLPLAV